MHVPFRRILAPVEATAAAAIFPSIFPNSVEVGPFHFLRPWWLLAAVPCLLLYWMIARRQDVGRAWRKVVAGHLLKHLLQGESRRSLWGPKNLMLCTWLLSVLSLAGPTWRREPSPFADDEAALVIAMEVTPTMLAQDVQPSRLKRSVLKIHDLLAARPGVRAALVAYAGALTS